MLTRISLKLVNWGVFQGSLNQIETDAQIEMYSLSRNIRNCQEIVSVSSDTLVLRTFNFASYGYSDPNLVDSDNLGIITYQYRADTKGLERRTQFPSSNQTSTSLKNVLMPPSDATPIFKGGPAPDPPYDYVEVILQVAPSFRKELPLTFRRTTMKRSRPK